MSEQKKFVDLEGLSYFWDKAKEYTANTVNPKFETLEQQINNIPTIIVDEEFNIESSNPIANKAVAKLAKTLDYETGIFGVGDEAWWVHADNNDNILLYFPYSIEGTYEKAGDFCTITAKVEKVENWKTIYYSLPMAAVASASTVVTAADGIVYNIWTTTQNYGGTDHSVVALERQDGSNMTRQGDDDPTSFIEFTLKYKYR